MHNKRFHRKIVYRPLTVQRNEWIKEFNGLVFSHQQKQPHSLQENRIRGHHDFKTDSERQMFNF